MQTITNILTVLDNVPSRTITVFGDYCLDKYLYIDPVRNEPSVETGLTAYQVERTALFPGAAGTVVNNLRSLGAQVRCVGLVGKDGEGYDLMTALMKIGADVELMVVTEMLPTNTYMKPMQKDTNGNYTEMNRLDRRSYTATSSELENRLLESLEKAMEESQGVVIIDQFLQRNCSVVTDRIRERIAGLAAQYPDKFFFADSRGFTGLYRNVIIKCNQHELPGGGKNEAAVIDRARKLLAVNGRAVVVTLGAEGALVFEENAMMRIPAFAVEGPIDIVGAGDATNAGSILGLTLGLSLSESVLLGGCVSSITIQQMGVTGSATVEQVKYRLSTAAL